MIQYSFCVNIKTIYDGLIEDFLNWLDIKMIVTNSGPSLTYNDFKLLKKSHVNVLTKS